MCGLFFCFVLYFVVFPCKNRINLENTFVFFQRGLSHRTRLMDMYMIMATVTSTDILMTSWTTREHTQTEINLSPEHTGKRYEQHSPVCVRKVHLFAEHVRHVIPDI